MALGADAVNGSAGGDPLVDVLDHAAGQLGGVGAVEVVVVDVQLGVRVGRAGRLEGDRDHVLAEDVVEGAAAEGAVFVEDFVGDVLLESRVSDEPHTITGTNSCNLHSHRPCPCNGS